MAKTYIEKLQDPKWQKKRLKILDRDNFTCTSCGDNKSTLHVHHISYRRVPWTVADDQLLTLCSTCHKFIEKIQKESKVGRVSSLKKRVGYDGIVHMYITKSPSNLYLGVDVLTLHKWNHNKQNYHTYHEIGLSKTVIDLMKGMIDG